MWGSMCGCWMLLGLNPCWASILVSGCCRDDQARVRHAPAKIATGGKLSRLRLPIPGPDPGPTTCRQSSCLVDTSGRLAVDYVASTETMADDWPVIVAEINRWGPGWGACIQSKASGGVAERVGEGVAAALEDRVLTSCQPTA
jgi:hypothetical protein